jgi:hypothetical protein
VGAMMFHLASMVAAFVDQAAQAPVQIQCVQQAAPESWVKWLLPTILQTVVSLASITAGVLIAIWSFRKNRQSEHEQWVRNQNAGHERWILDQKKIEWKELLKVVSDIEIVIPAVSKIQERYDSVSKCLPHQVARLLGIRASCVFLFDSLHREESVDAFQEFVGASTVAAECLQGFNAQSETDPAVRQLCRTKYEEIRNHYLKFCHWVQTEALRDMGVK